MLSCDDLVAVYAHVRRFVPCEWRPASNTTFCKLLIRLGSAIYNTLFALTPIALSVHDAPFHWVFGRNVHAKLLWGVFQLLNVDGFSASVLATFSASVMKRPAIHHYMIPHIGPSKGYTKCLQAMCTLCTRGMNYPVILGAYNVVRRYDPARAYTT